VVLDSQVRDQLREQGIGSPTWIQLLGTARIFDLDRDRAVERFKALLSDK
jgi:hypothetical protein